jgi:hypothetical protein
MDYDIEMTYQQIRNICAKYGAKDDEPIKKDDKNKETNVKTISNDTKLPDNDTYLPIIEGSSPISSVNTLENDGF